MADNKATFTRFCAAMSTGDPQVIERTIDELVAPDARIRTPVPVGGSGPDVLKAVFGHLVTAFPDLRVTVEDMVAEGDKVVSRNTVTGTHRGEHLGIAPTGRHISYDEIFIVRFAGGRIAETWGVVDVLAQLRQLGAVPAVA